MAMGVRKFSEDLEIRLDDSQNNIANIESILENIKKIPNETELKNCTEYYFRILENYDMINKVQLRQIIDALKDKKDFIVEDSYDDDFSEKFERVKESNENIKNFSIVETLKEDNDNTDGLKRGVTYLEFDDNGNKILYEISDIDKINSIFSDFDLIKNKNQYEIMNMLDDYCKKCDVINLETDKAELPFENYNDELNQISSSNVREIVDSHENAILKERVDFKDYVDKYKQGQEISYAFNSNGERIYIVEGEKYKFVGEDRTLKKLSQDATSDIYDYGVSKFNSESKGRGNLAEIELDKFTHITNYIGQEQLLVYIIQAMDNNIGISEKQNDFLARFISFGMECKAIGIELPGAFLRSIYDTFMMKFGEDKLKVMITKMTLEEINEKEKESVRELKLVPPKDNKLSNWEKAGFISVAIILESTLLLAGIFSILALVKK